jgi:hypothetical protein
MEGAEIDRATVDIQAGDTPTSKERNSMAWTTDELLTVEEAAEVLGVGVQRMYNPRILGRGQCPIGEVDAWCTHAVGWWSSWLASCGQH